jgi:hypothetical protein
MVSFPGRYSLGTVQRSFLGNIAKDRRLGKLRQALASGHPPALCVACPMHYGMF